MDFDFCGERLIAALDGGEFPESAKLTTVLTERGISP